MWAGDGTREEKRVLLFKNTRDIRIGACYMSPPSRLASFALVTALLVPFTIAGVEPSSPSRMNEIPMNEHDTRRLYEHWMQQAYTGLIAAVASER